MDINEALEIVRTKHSEKVLRSYEFNTGFVFILDTYGDVKLIIHVDKGTSKIAYTSLVGLQMMLAEEEPIIK